MALRLEKVVVATTGGGAPYALGVASYVPERVQGMLLISPLLSAGATTRNIAPPHLMLGCAARDRRAWLLSCTSPAG